MRSRLSVRCTSEVVAAPTLCRYEDVTCNVTSKHKEPITLLTAQLSLRGWVLAAPLKEVMPCCVTVLPVESRSTGNRCNNTSKHKEPITLLRQSRTTRLGLCCADIHGNTLNLAASPSCSSGNKCAVRTKPAAPYPFPCAPVPVCFEIIDGD